MTDEKVDQLCADIISENPDASNQAAKQLLSMSDDRGMRTELSKLVSKYQQAEDSVAMNDAFEDLIQYSKNQYIAIVRQGVMLGAAYQRRCYVQAMIRAQENEEKKGDDEQKGDQSNKDGDEK